jgi:hypothetical protein
LFIEQIDVNSLSAFAKIIFMTGLIICLIIFKAFKPLVLILILFLVFFAGHYNLGDFDLYSKLRVFLKYIFPLLLLLLLSKLEFEKLLLMFSGINYILAFNSILILTGVFFSLQLFKTYDGERFGYSGLLFASATATYVYLFHMGYCFVKLGKNLKLSKIEVFILFSSLFIGTKAIYFTACLMLFYMINVNIKKHKFIINTTILLSFGLILFSAFRASNVFNKVFSDHGFLSVILSKRDIIFKNITYPFILDNWSFVNYFFGGFQDFEIRSQIGLIDLVLTFGFFGATLYLIILYSALRKFNLDSISILFYSMLLLIVFISGNFFMYTFTQLLFALFFVKHLQLNNTNKISSF